MKNKLLVILLFVFIINFFNVTTSAQIVEDAKDFTSIHCKSDEIHMEFDDRPYFISELTDLTFKIDSSSDIKNVKYDFNGFEVIQFNREAKDSFSVRLGFSENAVSMNFKLIVKLSDDNVLVANIYGYQSDDLFFLSRASQENVDLLYYDYAFRTNIITEEEYKEILLEKSCLAEENLEISNCQKESNDLVLNSPDTTLASTSQTSTVSGTWTWCEGDYIHPLKYTTVNVIYFSSNSSRVTASTLTDENGYFSVELMISKTVDVKVQVYSSGTVTTVTKNAVSYPYSYITESKSLNPGDSVSFYSQLNNEKDTTFKAFKASQALIMGEKYVEAMTGEIAPAVTCYFPKNNSESEYDPIWRHINLEEEASNFWDVILHEYGHRVMDYYEIADYVGGPHDIYVDLFEMYGKERAIGMAWGEGWSTFFAILVTQYFGNELANIPFINDNIYQSFNYNEDGSIETLRFYIETPLFEVVGEGCEGAVAAALYDFFDPYSELEPWDNLSFSHKTMFTAVINSKATTFSSFLNYFINNYHSANDGKIGDILSQYGMSPTNLRIINGTPSYTTPPTFSWKAGGPESCSYNSFELAFYNSKKTMLLTTEKQSNTTLTLTLEQWNKILDSDIIVVYAMVIAYQTSSPSTGAYYSTQLAISRPFDAPHIHNFVYKSINSMTHRVTCNCGESFQESHDYYIDKLGRRCNKCGYFTKELTPVPITPSQICDIESIIKREDGF